MNETLIVMFPTNTYFNRSIPVRPGCKKKICSDWVEIHVKLMIECCIYITRVV